MKAQIILYNQCNIDYIQECVEHLYFLQVKGKPQTPAGELELNDYSKLLSYAIGREFTQDLQKGGYDANFFEIESYEKGLKNLQKKHKEIILMQPSEPYLADLWNKLAKKHDGLTIIPNQQFLIDHETFRQSFKKPPIIEKFYRRIRKETGVLMDGEKPVGGKRNYDKQNRGFDRDFQSAPVKEFTKSEGRKRAENYFGIEKDQRYPSTKKQAQSQLDFFLEKLLDRFGELQDAMYTQSDFVHHSLLSVALNFGLLTPQEVIAAVEKKDTDINNKEGCIRQILGRREYMFHYLRYYKDTIYKENALEHMSNLPYFFRRPDQSTLNMNCINHVLKKVETHAYSHHIERLMIIGNFTLLCGIDPHQVNQWFRERYADAFERVVTPNVLSMSQYADGGKLATKPYVSSANYINKMSNYCKSCFYDPKAKKGEKACPFNYLYRNFINKHQELFSRQPYITTHLKNKDTDMIAEQTKKFLKKHMGQD